VTQDGADLVAVQADDVGLVVDLGAADVHTWGTVDRALLLGVAVEADDRAQPACDRRSGFASILEITGEPLDVDAANLEQVPAAPQPPSGELTQIQRVGVTGVTPVRRQECRLPRAWDHLSPGSCHEDETTSLPVMGPPVMAMATPIERGIPHISLGRAGGAGWLSGRSQCSRSKTMRRAWLCGVTSTVTPAAGGGDGFG
jgi:hypothetical protein